MKIQLTKTLPQPELGRVIPAGVIIDAPPALAERLFREGRAKPVPDGTEPSAGVATGTTDAPEAKGNGTPQRKRVKRNG